MLIYEKNNKLNINFDNEISENPDLQIGKNGDKTEVLVDGSSNPTIPVPVLPEDVGKTIVVNEDGTYKLDDVPAELPSVSDSDNGKILGVTNGTWEKVEAPSGGDNTFVVSFTVSGSTVTCDKTYADIASAISENKTLLAKIEKVNGGVVVNHYVTNLWKWTDTTISATYIDYSSAGNVVNFVYSEIQITKSGVFYLYQKNVAFS